MDIRIGHGYDVHQFEENRPLIIGGVSIAHEKGLKGHSDADVLTHVIMDAILGALALGDIGTHFPDTDDAYKGASSIALLHRVMQMMRDAGYEISNLDATIVAQAPKFSPYIMQMRQNLAREMQLQVQQVSIKATTEEWLGFTGSGEGMAAHCVCLLQSK